MNHFPQNLKKRYRFSLAKVEATCILAIGFLNDQNCRKKKDKWKHLRWNLQKHIYTNMRFAMYTNIS